MAEDTVFKDARDNFLASLQPYEKTLFIPCNNADDLLNQLKTHYAFKPKRSLIRQFMAKIEEFGESLTPFFGAIGLVVQSHPEVAAIVWGAIRLVIQLASNFNSFFRKLIDTLDRLIQVFPLYSDIPILFKGRQLPARLKKSLSSVYTDLLNFLQTVIRIFAKQDGSTKRSYSVFADICWKSYDLRFKELFEDLQFHSELVKSDLQLAAYQQAKETHEKAIETYVQTSEVLKTLQSIENEFVGYQQKRLEITEKNAERIQLEMNKCQRLAKETHRTTEKLHKAIQNRTNPTEHYRFFILGELRRWLDPPKFAFEFERALEKREEGTGRWFLEHTNFRNWSNTTCSTLKAQVHNAASNTKLHERSLWIRGNPGYGKTTLAASAIEELQTSYPNHNTCYFFFRQGTPKASSPSQAYRSILAQVLKHRESDDELIDKLIFAMNKGASGQSQATKNELLDTISLCASCEKIQYIVLDGIDECEDSLELLTDLCNAFETTPVKIIMFSRPHVKAPRAMSAIRYQDIGKSLYQDIKVYLFRRINSMVEDDLLPPDIEAEQLIEKLLTGADGMFLWAVLMMNYLYSSSLTRTKRLKEIQKISSPEGLETMYDRILHQLSLQNRPDQDFASWVFMWLNFSSRSLSAEELECTFTVRSANEEDDDIDFPDFKATVITTCGSLVESGIVYHPKTMVEYTGYRFIHLSVYEFFTARLNTESCFFILSKPESHLLMARAILHYITLNIPRILIERERLSEVDRELTEARRMNVDFPFLEYAIVNWIQHLQLSQEGSNGRIIADEGRDENTASASHSLRKKTQDSRQPSAVIVFQIISSISSIAATSATFKQYIDLSYRLGTFDLSALPNWLDWTRSTHHHKDVDDVWMKNIKKATDIAQYLLLINEQWGSKLQVRPWLIWDEIPAFTPSHLLDESTGIRVHRLWTGEHQRSHSSTHLCKVSVTSRDHEHIGILSIWPSKEYEDISTNAIMPNLPIDRIWTSSRGWFARYEIWSNDKLPRCLIKKVISLEDQFIWEQYRRSLTITDSSNGLKIHFPIGISACLQRFTILGRIFFYRPRKLAEAQLSWLDLPFPFDHIKGTWWGPESESDQSTQSFQAWREQNCILTYWLYFDQCCHRLLFVGSVPPVPRSWLSLVVLEVEGTPQPSISRKGPLKKLYIQENTRWTPHDLHPIFHPSLPLLLFTAPQPPCVWACLWAYRGDHSSEINPPEDQPSSGILQEEEFSIDGSQQNLFGMHSDDPSARAWYSPGIMALFKMGQAILSNDGLYLILRSGHEHTVIRIPGHILDICKRTAGNSKGADSHSVALATFHSCDFSISEQDVAGKSTNSLIRTNGYSVAKDGTVANFVTKTSNGRLEAALQTRDNKRRRNNQTSVFEIAALPAALCNLSNVSSTLQAPDISQNSVRIVLNQVAKPWYDMSKSRRSKEQEENILPIIIDRDMQCIRFDARNSRGKLATEWLHQSRGITAEQRTIGNHRQDSPGTEMERLDEEHAVKRIRKT